MFESLYGLQPFPRFRSRFHRFIERQDQGKSYVLVAEFGDEIVATGQLALHRDSAEISDLIVHTDYRGRGLGTATIQVLTALGQYQEFKRIEIGVAVTNERAMALYERLGFAEDRRIRLLNGDPAIILSKAL